MLQILSTEPGQLQPATPGNPALLTGTTPGEEAPPSALELAATRPVLPEGVTPSVAPPPAVFVAASVRQAPVAPPPAPLNNLPPPPPSQVIAPPLTGLTDIEARLASARAGQVAVNVLPAPPPVPTSSGPGAPASLPPPPPVPTAGAPVATSSPSAVQQPSPPVPQRFSFPPPITQSTRFSELSTASPAPAPAANAPAGPAPTGLAAFRDPAALVRALGLPVTPTNIAAAKLAIDTPQRLPAALATLESALPDSEDPRVATLRTLSAFVGRLEPSSPQLAAQISAYVDNVVRGNEPKLVQLLAAQLAAAEQPEGAPAAAPGAGTVAEGATAGAPPPVAAAPALPVVALAQVVERGAALSVDLKTQLLAVINAPPAGSEEGGALVPAATSALSAITAVQMNAAQAMNASPQTMAFTLPMWLGSGYAQAHIAIDRDAPEPSSRNLDGDNFHIAFVLDTKNLGTVTVDLQTVGRAFSLAVKTESEGSAKRFADQLDTLTTRLEKLRYRVNSAEASVAPRGAAPVAGTPDVPAVDEPPEEDGVGSDVNVRA